MMIKPNVKPSENHGTRIMIVDDHPVFRRGLAELVLEATDLKLCGQAGDASDAMRQMNEAKPDLIVVDLSLSSGSGLELIKQIKAIDKKIRVLVCTMHDEKVYCERAMRAGADGYLNKEAAPEDLVTAIRQVLAGKVYVSEEMAEKLIQQRFRGNDGNVESPQEVLSDREFEVFQMIGDGQSSRKIAVRLGLSPKTVDTHREHIKSKLGAEDNADLVRRAVEWVVTRNKA